MKYLVLTVVGIALAYCVPADAAAGLWILLAFIAVLMMGRRKSRNRWSRHAEPDTDWLAQRPTQDNDVFRQSRDSSELLEHVLFHSRSPLDDHTGRRG